MFSGLSVAAAYTLELFGWVLILLSISVWFSCLTLCHKRGTFSYLMCWWSFGLSFITGALYWIVEYISTNYIESKFLFLFTFLICVLSVPYLFAGIASYKFFRNSSIFLTPLMLVLIELAREYMVDFPIPSLTASYLFIDILPASFYRTYGSIGTSLLIYFLCFLLINIIFSSNINKNNYKIITSLIITFTLTPLILTREQNLNDYLHVRVLNDSFDVKRRFTKEGLEQKLNDYLTLSLKKPLADITVWPESSLIPEFTDTKILHQIVLSDQQDILLGVKLAKNQGMENFIMSLNQSETIYKKNFPIPFEEYIPSWFLHVFQYQDDSKSQGNTGKIKAGFIKLADKKGMLAICYDLLFSRLFVQNDYNFIVIISDLNWNTTLWLERMMFNIARARALEHDVPVIMSSNNGISGLIQASGAFTKIRSLTPSLLDGKIYVSSHSSIYNSYPYLTICLFAIISLIFMVKNKKGRHNNEKNLSNINFY